MKKRNKSTSPPRDAKKHNGNQSKIIDFEVSEFKHQKQTKSKPK